LEEAWKKQTSFAKYRLAKLLALQTSILIPEVLSNSMRSCLTNYDWSDEERAQMQKIVTVLGNIQELLQQLKSLSMPLITTYYKPSSSPPISLQDRMEMDDGAPRINKSE
jgi:hypothetical protein